jgi:hypothetical protein
MHAVLRSDDECSSGAAAGCPSRQWLLVAAQRRLVDDRVSPAVQVDDIGGEMCAQADRLARDWIHEKPRWAGCGHGSAHGHLARGTGM